MWCSVVICIVRLFFLIISFGYVVLISVFLFIGVGVCLSNRCSKVIVCWLRSVGLLL